MKPLVSTRGSFQEFLSEVNLFFLSFLKKLYTLHCDSTKSKRKTMEYKSISFEVKDLNKKSRTAIIAHAVYNNIDRVGDISVKGMFNKSWSESKVIDFLYNHNESKPLGNVIRNFEDENKAYTEVLFGNWKMADDVMEMIDAKVIKGASFGYNVIQKEYVIIKGETIRKLTEVKHIETSLLTYQPANPKAGVISLNKSLSVKSLPLFYNDLVSAMENFIKDTSASDECIKGVTCEMKEIKNILLSNDTVSTRPIPGPDTSKDSDNFRKQILLLNLQQLYG